VQCPGAFADNTVGWSWEHECIREPSMYISWRRLRCYKKLIDPVLNSMTTMRHRTGTYRSSACGRIAPPLRLPPQAAINTSRDTWERTLVDQKWISHSRVRDSQHAAPAKQRTQPKLERQARTSRKIPSPGGRRPSSVRRPSKGQMTIGPI